MNLYTIPVNDKCHLSVKIAIFWLPNTRMVENRVNSS